MTVSGPFSDLPTDILHLIFSTFCLHCRAKDKSPAPDAYFRGTQQQRDEPSWYSLERHALFSMCLVSKSLRDIAQPFLYHEFVPGYGDSWRSSLYTWDGRLISFMKTVAQRRDLAALVKRIYIHSYLLEPVDDEKARDALKQVANALRVKLWHQSSANELVTMLIAELPNLEHLSIQDGSSPLSNIRSSDLLTAGVSGLTLKTIDITLRAFSNSIDSSFLLNASALTIFELATGLETLNLHMCHGFQYQAVIPSLPNLKTLRITHSRLGNMELEQLLSSCLGLHTFVYEAASTPVITGECGYMRMGPHDHSGHIELSNIVGYLSRHSETLKFLHLDLRQRPRTQDENLSSLKSFTALKHLFLNLSQFHCWYENMPSEIYLLLNPTSPPNHSKNASPVDSRFLVWLLPRDIAELHLLGCVYKALDLVKSLLALADAVSQGQFPRLKRVRCDTEQKFDGDSVETMFATAGVDFGYDSWPLSDATLQTGDIPPPPTSFPDIPLPDPDEYPDL